MIIGVPKEIKIGETRVSMTPSLCRRCVALGAKVLIQKSAGLTAGFSDAEYRAAGATLVADAARVWRSAELIVKVKEPLPAEFPLLRQGQLLFTYLHLAAEPEVAQAIADGRFHVWSVESIDQGIELLTGVPAGVRGDDGRYPEGTIYRRVEDRLDAFAAALQQRATGTTEVARTSNQPGVPPP